MKLAILGSRGIPASYGGFETFAEELSVRLSEAGVDVTVFCQCREHRPDQWFRGVTLRYVPVIFPPPFEQAAWDAQCLWLCRRGYDVVYMLGAGGSFMAWAPRLYGAKVWINTDGLEWRRSKWSHIGRLYLRAAEAVAVALANTTIADSAAIGEYLTNAYGNWAAIETIAYGAREPVKRPDSGVLARWGVDPERYYLVVCRLEPENQVRELIEGHARSRSTLPLVILGDIERKTVYARDLRRFRCERVKFIGTEYDVKRLAALRYYARAYLHGHSAGGTNPSLLEAMACKNLIIAHDNPFNREVLQDMGLYFRSSDDLGSRLQSVQRGDLDEQRMREGARSIVDRYYTWERVANQYLELLSAADVAPAESTPGPSTSRRHAASIGERLRRLLL